MNEFFPSTRLMRFLGHLCAKGTKNHSFVNFRNRHRPTQHKSTLLFSTSTKNSLPKLLKG
jgi:hypothetical protein